MIKYGKKLSWYAKTYIGSLMAFLYLPIMILIAFSFNESKSRSVFTGITLNWYKSLVTNELIINSLINSLVLAFLSSIIATIIGTAAAIGMSRMKKRGRKLLLNITYLPMINPDILTGVSFMLLFTSAQAVFAWIGISGIKFGFGTLLLSHITFNIPYIILNVRPKLRQMDASLYEAAQDLGCDGWQAFYMVVLPDIMPGVMSGFLTAITMSIDDFIISYFVSGPTSQTLPITIFSMTRRKVSPEINALSTIMFFVILLVLLLINFYDAQKEQKMKKNRIKRGVIVG